ncbi:MAG: glucosidase family protein [Armatimonadota bacterium]
MSKIVRNLCRYELNCILTFVVFVVVGGMVSADSTSRDTIWNIPNDFTTFQFSGKGRESQILSYYLWYHFDTRLSGGGKAVFNKEYLTLSDLWVVGAIDKSAKKRIQDLLRTDLSNTQLDDEGYVHTHQHFSYAHENGWPFPIWTQSGTKPEQVNGQTAGWHFQQPPGWTLIAAVTHGWNAPQYFGETATQGWELSDVRSLGVQDGKWQLESTGISPSITTPKGVVVDASQAPFLQLRWKRIGEPSNCAMPYVEWMRDCDTSFGADRRVCFGLRSTDASEICGIWRPEDNRFNTSVSDTEHCMIEMYRHPKWTGKIKRMRIVLAPGESHLKFAIDSFFTVYDTRQSMNNPIFILACWNYFRWTGDLDFLRANIGRMRTALRYDQTVMGGFTLGHIRNPWTGHDGLPAWKTNSDGSKTFFNGHGISDNYYDLLPFGWDDMYATSLYYAATMAMADVELAVRDNPGWNVSCGALAFDPGKLYKHAQYVAAVANKKFWNKDTGRFVGCIDKKGKAHDYGFTYMNLEAVWRGLPTPEHSQEIMAWVTGRRIVKGDTSTGADIYKWEFGPRTTTRRNIEWYIQGWYAPESLPWGGQIQDGGAVLGFSFYDIMARLKVLGPDDAWKRLNGLLDWEEKTLPFGNYREYYKQIPGSPLQGGGAAGGLGIDVEFFESSLVPSAVIYGFMGLNPKSACLCIDPKLPAACPEMTIKNMLYHEVRLDVKAGVNYVEITIKDMPTESLHLKFNHGRVIQGTTNKGHLFEISEPGTYRFLLSR